MKQSLLFWVLAVLLTVAAAIYQRTTGPSYPLRGSVDLNGRSVRYELERSHPGATNHTVALATGDAGVAGTLAWRRYRTADDWSVVPMVNAGGTLSAELPAQPPAGKLEYRVTLTDASREQVLPPSGTVVIRFRGDVPPLILVTHVGLMFIGLVVSTRAGLEFFARAPRLGTLIPVTIALFTVGGLVFGPLVQKYAFGAYWTGWPFGGDLTDNKTAAMVLLWLAAAWGLRKAQAPARWALVAAILTLGVYLIPHSMLGSELDYTKADRERGAATPR